MRVFAKTFLWATVLSLITTAATSENVLESLGSRDYTESADTASALHVNPKLRFTQGTEGTRPVRLSKRFPFSSGRDEWCGEQAEDPAADYSASAPSAVDCQALVNSLGDQNGFWTLQPGDFSSDGWARVASLGSCSFAVRHASSGGINSPMRIGTNDVRFYTTRYGVLAKDGKLGLQGTVQCYNSQNLLFVTWGLIRS
ncbi:hypothetical protein CSHISOI_03125 [Colletotrichum shisoi]|uniref:Ecp2 effector protein-like domain-containing protein n=1 Tax=Colletotrichum shisoi TaxID=2078593 RepID=A0A5Q4BZ71_9PEZI|nr:hypothetical protein CSHISOI_03125 [Colletotrichum shisoi]